MHIPMEGGAIEVDKISPVVGGLAVTVFARRPVKGRSGRSHLNIDFESELPADASGIFAELGGVRNMSAATKALLKQPGLTPARGSRLYQSWEASL